MIWHYLMGSNSMTDGIYSQTGRLIKSLNKHVFDQTTVAAFPGSSGGGVFLKSDARYVGMLVRGAGETFNLIVPVRRMVEWAEKNDIMWALDSKVKLPSDDVLSKMSVEDVGADFSSESNEKRKEKRLRVQKHFPFLLKTQNLRLK